MRTIVVSPSGAFYGSEQTLFSFLSNTDTKYTVFVKKEPGLLLDKLSKTIHKVKSFSNVKLLYFRLLLNIFFLKIDRIYVNEGGHIKYCKLLGKIFPKLKIVIHLRLVEDTTKGRLHGLPKNLELISVSTFIKNLVLNEIGTETQVLSSPMRELEFCNSNFKDLEKKDIYKVGIVGRVTPSKGVKNIIEFINYLELNKISAYELHFFGTVEDQYYEVTELISLTDKLTYVKLYFHGFTSCKSRIFEESDLIIHFNEHEPLGVVYFESLSYGTPFFGFNSGGIGDISEVIELNNVIENDSDWPNNMLETIKSIGTTTFSDARERMKLHYGIDQYVNRLENIIGS